MRFTRLRLANWRNFRAVDVPLRRRVFITGPNASGKSNLLDVFRFLRDVADPEGGFQRAVQAKRGGVSQIRSLHARQHSDVEIEVEVDVPDGGTWGYELHFNQDNNRRPIVRREIVRRGGETVLARPTDDPADPDRADSSRLSQTYLEQVNSNRAFRELAAALTEVRYLHLVPQLIREPDRSVGRVRDPYGGDFLEQMARLERTHRRAFQSRKRRITEALRVAVPQLKELELERDDRGAPHLRGRFEHWRPNAGWQTEDQFSDGTLRLLGLLWSLLDGTGPLMLEEPELSLHPGVVRHIATMIARVSNRSGRQVMISTHSPDLLSDPGIAPEEVLLLSPSKEGTEVRVGAEDPQFTALLQGGALVFEAAIPLTSPRHPEQLLLFSEEAARAGGAGRNGG